MDDYKPIKILYGFLSTFKLKQICHYGEGLSKGFY